MHRSYDAALMQEAYESNPIPTHPINYQDWLDKPKNLMLIHGDDVTLFSWEYDGVYSAHWFYVSRGKGVLETAKLALDTLFNEYGAEAVRGITPVANRPACYMVRRVGFKSYGKEVFPSGTECELFIMTKEDYNGRYR